MPHGCRQLLPRQAMHQGPGWSIRYRWQPVELLHTTSVISLTCPDIGPKQQQMTSPLLRPSRREGLSSFPCCSACSSVLGKLTSKGDVDVLLSVDRDSGGVAVEVCQIVDDEDDKDEDRSQEGKCCRAADIEQSCTYHVV